MTTTIASADEARAAGRAAALEGGIPLHDLTGHMAGIGVPLGFRSHWLSGFEEGLEAQGFDVEGEDDSDGYGWERRALAGV